MIEARKLAKRFGKRVAVDALSFASTAPGRVTVGRYHAFCGRLLDMLPLCRQACILLGYWIPWFIGV